MHNRVFNPAQAHKLEDPERLTFLPPREVVRALDVRPGTEVADIGAGTGYFAIPIARAIQPGGRVYAVDLQDQMLRLLDSKLGAPDAPDNITLVHGAATSSSLPDSSCDLVLLANIWHELDDHVAALQEAARILRPSGKIAILDWRTDVPARHVDSQGGWAHHNDPKDGEHEESESKDSSGPVPPGPPAEHRISVEEASRTLETHGWQSANPQNIGLYSYLLIATCG